ncbi:BnaA08g29330D [Brassica napus]|uniref:BnaA08g29330D protein n=1 Tax=Brassica napus TaxID=3708 RepID=A0A078INK6_BRANA|nr:BnaA08g29330D [Brassica napus]
MPPLALSKFSQILIPMKPTRNSSSSTERPSSKKTVVSAASAEPNGKSAIRNSPSFTEPASSEKIVVSSVSAKRNGKSIASSATVMKPSAHADVSLGPHEAEMRFRLIHLWEARNPNTKVLIGQKMLLIDEEGTVIQGFVPAGRVGTFDLSAGSIYKLTNFFGSRSKYQYRVADHSATVSFSWNSSLSVLENPPVFFPVDRFRFHSYDEFRANCDSKGDLYDFVGHMKLVSGQTITDHIVLDEADISEKRHLCVHVQSLDGPVLKLYLWDQAASEFCQKFKSYGGTPSVLLVTTVNPKHLGGTLAITSMSSSRVFMDSDVQPTKDYLEWLSSNAEIANRIAAEVVTKPEAVTLEELFAYIKQETSKVAWFECTATIDDVVRGSPWYYISCGGCNSKAFKGPTSLICNNKKCVKNEVTGVPQYLTKISVYDKSEQAAFVILGDAGKELSGKHAAELVATYYESNEGVGADHCVPIPQALLDTIGQTRKFIVKVSDHNLSGKIQTITVTKILPLATTVPATSEEPGASSGLGNSAGDRARKAAEMLESSEAKRCKSG